MKHLLIKIIVIMAAYSGGFPTQAQITIKEALSKVYEIPLPHNAAKEVRYKRRASIYNPNNIIPNKLYENFQLTEYFLADNNDTKPAMIAKFKIPNQNYTLATITFGGVTDWITEVLITVDSNGNVIGALEATILFFPGIPAKQYRILSDGSVIVTVLKPTTTKSVLFEDFTSFTANRVDETYKIENGKFVLKDTKTYPVATYTRNQLADKSYNLWD